jgi:hypothetical protein
MRWLVTIVVLVTACGSKEKQCGPEAYELEEYLKRTDKGLNWLDVEGVKLVERTDLEKRFAQQSLVLRVRRGMPVDVADSIQQLRYSSGQLGQRVKTDQVALLIEGDVPWEDVVGASNAAMSAGAEKVVFVFAAKPAVEPPPRTKIDDDLDRAEKEPGMRAQRMAEIGKALIDPCVPLAKAFGKVAYSDADRETQLIKAVTPALLECDCKIDMGALRSWLYRLVASKPLAVIDVIVSPESPNRIELPPETPWREAQKKLTKDLRSVVLAVPAPEPPPEELTDAGVDAR